MMTSKLLIKYLAVVYILSWAMVGFGIMYAGDINNIEKSAIWLFVSMWMPTFVTIYFIWKDQSLLRLLKWKPNHKIYLTSLIAVIVPICIAFIVLIMVENLGYGRSVWFDFSRQGVLVSGGPYLMGLGQQSWLYFSTNVVITGATYALINLVATVGEEFAWRGFLQGILIARFGTFKGISLLGLIWSYWHLPALLDGYNFPNHPILGSFVIFPILSVATSFFYAWLTLKTDSFISAAIAHGALNGIQEGIVSNIEMNGGRLYEDLLTLIATVVVGLFFATLLYFNRNRTIQRFP